ncbi:tRNA dihydrouridine synthase DusB [Megasphaera paucivorans]|uniref:tRNA-dihydrouridine synthase n=1 Tax=Megasphaera paucivorans TaxID=349095 RepID=A0A1G9VU55_9FIRM|nr:tRNA dihydrouridine synthase DusB [Megasphaera paucivorans]SDM75764.1 tRNA-dihydrouridine synthase B [Megasphaera paucivorans]
MIGTIKPLSIGSVTLEIPVILAPMAGVCDLPYRVIARHYGAAMVCAEMVSDKGLLYHNRHTQEMLRIDPREHPLSMQIFGSDPATMANAAQEVEKAGADVVDINMGCPVNKVVKNQEGSALMKDLPRAEAIIAAVVSAVSLPVTVKMRTGWDADHNTAVELAKRAEQAGAAAVTVHGRTREQFYMGKADWTKIKDVVQAVTIPVIGNGDITDGPSALQMFEETGCRGIMIGRGAQGNPWIFPQIIMYLKTGKILPPPTAAERYEQLLEHFESLLAYKGEYIALREMRAHAAWYTKGMHGSAALRERINRAAGVAEFRNIIRKLL